MVTELGPDESRLSSSLCMRRRVCGWVGVGRGEREQSRTYKGARSKQRAFLKADLHAFSSSPRPFVLITPSVGCHKGVEVKAQESEVMRRSTHAYALVASGCVNLFTVLILSRAANITGHPPTHRPPIQAAARAAFRLSRQQVGIASRERTIGYIRAEQGET
jgi:hypothetical protein